MTTINNSDIQKIKSKNYIIDGDSNGIIESDFFIQLKNMLSQSECHEDHDHDTNDKNVENEDNFCLLTKEPLQNIHIILTCGHKFNYIPLYREVIAQKTTGLSSTGYFTPHLLKRNEIKCPYCRNVQDKLLPYLEYEGVKKIVNINYPTKLSMTSQPCMYSANVHSKKSKKSVSCKENAIMCHNGIYVCKKHYDLSVTSVTTPSLDTSNTVVSSPTLSSSKCGIILRYGKNKGKPCLNPSSCRVHKNKDHCDTM